MTRQLDMRLCIGDARRRPLVTSKYHGMLRFRGRRQTKKALSREAGLTPASIQRFVDCRQSLGSTSPTGSPYSLGSRFARGSTMGSLFKKAVTGPLPPRAAIVVLQGERLARW
jgi:hypothetical protein